MTASSPPTILYIAGSGRSGSTLLERVLAGIPAIATVGEVLDLPRKVAPADEICGCGAKFSLCSFWQAVGARAWSGFDPEFLRETHKMQAAVARQRHLPKLLTARNNSPFNQALQAYTSRYAELATSVATEANANYIVDASKWPALALALHRGGLDVRVIHLIRDVRGVAHSLNQADIERPHSTGGTDLMFHNSPASGAGRWLATQTEVDLIRTRKVPIARLAYDDFVTDPAASIRRTLTSLKVPIPADGLAHISGTTVQLGPSHGLSGNPSRFRHGATQLRTDVRWRSQMRRRDQFVATTVGLPQLLILKGSTASRKSQPTASLEQTP